MRKGRDILTRRVARLPIQERLTEKPQGLKIHVSLPAAKFGNQVFKSTEGVAVVGSIDNRRKQKSAIKHSKTQYLEMFGLPWDDWLNPLCPVDQSVLRRAAAYPDKHGNSDLLACPKMRTAILD